ncbi:MAG: hypothetical protein ACI7YS_09750 [Flavobacterium sp.]
MKIKSIFLLLAILFSSLSFSQSKTPFLINDELFELPGKWEVKNFLKNSAQYHLYNKKKKLNVLISVRKPSIFEFYKDTLSQKQFLEKFYKWETDYWASENGLKAEVKDIKHNESDDFIIWRLTVKNVEANNGEDIISNILYFMRNKKLIG